MDGVRIGVADGHAVERHAATFGGTRKDWPRGKSFPCPVECQPVSSPTCIAENASRKRRRPSRSPSPRSSSIRSGNSGGGNHQRRVPTRKPRNAPGNGLPHSFGRQSMTLKAEAPPLLRIAFRVVWNPAPLADRRAGACIAALVVTPAARKAGIG